MAEETNVTKVRQHWFLGLSFIVGLVIFALLLDRTVHSAKRMNEFVSVKGLSEREMPADLAIWPITFNLGDNDLGKLQQQIEKSRKAVQEFLATNGFEPGEISNAPPQITDTETFTDTSETQKVRLLRYQAKITVLLRSPKIPKVKVAMENCDKLVQQGIALSGGDYSGKPQFLFTGINQVKPDMIQEANRNARKAAEKFAADSDSRIGSIRHATQGPFEVNDVDSSSPDRKTVRVVTTVDYYLR